MWDQLRAVRDGDVGELEVERAKRIYESQFVRRLEDMEGQANYLAEWEALGDWRMGDRYLERLLTTYARRSRRRGESLSRSGQRRRHRVPPDVERADCRRRRGRCARCSTRDPRPAPLAAPTPYVRARAARRRESRTFDARGSGRSRLSHGSTARRSSFGESRTRRCVHAGRVRARWIERGSAGACRTHDADGPHVAQGHGVAQRAPNRRRRRDARRQRRRHRRRGELRLVDLRADALRRRRRSSCCRTSCSTRRWTTTRSRPSARSRSRTSLRCATTCIAIRCDSRRRRRSPGIRTAFRRAAPRRRSRASMSTPCASGTVERALSSPSVIAIVGDGDPDELAATRGARVRRSPPCRGRGDAGAGVADAHRRPRRGARSRADGDGACCSPDRRATIRIDIRRR